MIGSAYMKAKANFITAYNEFMDAHKKALPMSQAFSVIAMSQFQKNNPEEQEVSFNADASDFDLETFLNDFGNVLIKISAKTKVFEVRKENFEKIMREQIESERKALSKLKSLSALTSDSFNYDYMAISDILDLIEQDMVMLQEKVNAFDEANSRYNQINNALREGAMQNGLSFVNVDGQEMLISDEEVEDENLLAVKTDYFRSLREDFRGKVGSEIAESGVPLREVISEERRRQLNNYLSDLTPEDSKALLDAVAKACNVDGSLSEIDKNAIAEFVSHLSPESAKEFIDCMIANQNDNSSDDNDDNDDDDDELGGK